MSHTYSTTSSTIEERRNTGPNTTSVSTDTRKKDKAEGSEGVGSHGEARGKAQQRTAIEL
jgi:hypothetical protein